MQIGLNVFEFGIIFKNYDRNNYLCRLRGTFGKKNNTHIVADLLPYTPNRNCCHANDATAVENAEGEPLGTASQAGIRKETGNPARLGCAVPRD